MINCNIIAVAYFLFCPSVVTEVPGSNLKTLHLCCVFRAARLHTKSVQRLHADSPDVLIILIESEMEEEIVVVCWHPELYDSTSYLHKDWTKNIGGHCLEKSK